MAIREHENKTFGQDPEDSELLIRHWNETRPATPGLEWNAFWESVCHEAANPADSAGIGKRIGGSSLRRALAASLLIGLTIAGLRPFAPDRGESPELVERGGSTVATTDAISGLASVSIDLEEVDALAVIRVGYEECPMPNPCVESVEGYLANGSESSSLASNFQLLNEFESIASE